MKDEILAHYLQQNLKSFVIYLDSTCRPTERVTKHFIIQLMHYNV